MTRDKLIQVRVSTEERESLATLADRAGYTLSGYVRAVALFGVPMSSPDDQGPGIRRRPLERSAVEQASGATESEHTAGQPSPAPVEPSHPPVGQVFEEPAERPRPRMSPKGFSGPISKKS